jgi:hypothetical protein
VAVAFSLYVRWWLGRAVNETPKIQVKVKSDQTTTVVRLLTRGTRRQFRLHRIIAPRDAEAGSIGTPKGFRQTLVSEDTVTWTPRRPIILPPAHPIDLRITHEPGDPVMVQGRAVSRLAFGGTWVQCDILVRETDSERRGTFNRQSAQEAEAADGRVAHPGQPERRQQRAR